MAIAPTVLANNINTTDATSFATASVAVASHYNELITLAVFSIAAADPNIPTLTTARGLSISQVQTRLETANHARITIFRTCIASGGSTGTLVIDFAGQTQLSCAWAVTSWTGTRATAGNNGSDAIGVTAVASAGSNPATSISCTLAALQTGSATYGAVTHAISEGTTPGSGYTELSDNNAAGPGAGFETEWKLAGSTTVDASWTTSAGSFPRIIVGAEIINAADTGFVGAIPI